MFTKGIWVGKYMLRPFHLMPIIIATRPISNICASSSSSWMAARPPLQRCCRRRMPRAFWRRPRGRGKSWKRQLGIRRLLQTCMEIVVPWAASAGQRLRVPRLRSETCAEACSSWQERHKWATRKWTGWRKWMKAVDIEPQTSKVA